MVYRQSVPDAPVLAVKVRIHDTTSLIPAELIRQLFLAEAKLLKAIPAGLGPDVHSFDKATSSISMHLLEGYTSLSKIISETKEPPSETCSL